MSQWFYAEVRGLGLSALIEACSEKDEVQVTWVTSESRMRGDQLILDGQETWKFVRLMSRVGAASMEVRSLSRAFALLVNEPRKRSDLQEHLDHQGIKLAVKNVEKLMRELESHGLAEYLHPKSMSRAYGWALPTVLPNVGPVQSQKNLKIEAEELYQEGIRLFREGEHDGMMSSFLEANRLNLAIHGDLGEELIGAFQESGIDKESGITLARQIIWGRKDHRSGFDRLAFQALALLDHLESSDEP